MMILGFLVIICSLVLVYKSPQYTISMFALIISLSPFFSKHLSSNAYYLSLLLIVFIFLIKILSKRMLTMSTVIIISFSLIFLLLQIFLLKISPTQIILYMFKFIAIPFIVYYSLRFTKSNNISISKTFYPYFLINLIVVYIRAFVDYSFFGTLTSYAGTIYQNLYIIGGANFRPSNLNSPIIFSIELVVFIMLLFVENAPVKNKRYFVLFSILPLIFMRSRSSYILILFFGFVILMKNRKYIKVIIASSIAGISMMFTEVGQQILDIITFKDQSYVVRSTSVLKSINIFLSENIKTIIFGFGSGYTNYELVPGEGFNIYVENFHLSLLFDMGIIMFTLWIILNVLLLFASTLSKSKLIHQYATILAGILLVNLFSSNLTAYSVQIFYWIIVFKILSKSRIRSLDSKKISCTER